MGGVERGDEEKAVKNEQRRNARNWRSGEKRGGERCEGWEEWREERRRRL